METIKKGVFFDPWWRFSIIYAMIVEVCIITLWKMTAPGIYPIETVIIFGFGFVTAMFAFLIMIDLCDEAKPCQN